MSQEILDLLARDGFKPTTGAGWFHKVLLGNGAIVTVWVDLL